MSDPGLYPVIQNAAARPGRSLGGRWRSIIDPYDVGSRSIYGDPWPLGFWREFPLRPGIGEYDFEQSELLDVPGDWNSQDPRLFFYEGCVWYKRTFEVALEPGRRRFLHFGAANHETHVYLNGEAIGRHQGGFTPFCFEVTERVREGPNALIVKVDATRRSDGVPGLQTDWWNYGGLTREVRLLELPGTFVRDYLLRLAGDGSVEGWVQLDGPTATEPIRLVIDELQVELGLTPDARGRADLRLDVRPRPWSPESPNLYSVSLGFGEDEVRDRIGFRRIESRGTEILLNGEPVFLRGISIHEEAPIRSGRSFGEDDARTLLGWAKELGCNFVRLAHYTHDEATVRLADELGLLVWGEVPVYWNLAWTNPATLANAKYQLRSMLERDRNRASFILCSIGNEAPGTPERLAFMGELAEHVRETDPTRLVTCALMARHEEGRMTIEDPMAGHLDVLGCNEYLGWYYGDVESVAEVRWECSAGKPLILSEFGAGAVAGRHGEADELFSEEHQARVYEGQIAMMQQIPFLAGLSPWILMDFRTPRRLLPGIQDHYNRKGLVSERGQRKRAFAVLRDWYERLEENASARRPPPE